MKKIILSFIALCLTLMIQAQSNPVDEMFNRYSEKQGFTVVSISSRMFSMFANKDADKKDTDDITKFLIKQSGNIITELLVVTGGPGGNSLISIKGELNLKNISDMSKSLDMQELKGLDKLQKKSPEE